MRRAVLAPFVGACLAGCATLVSAAVPAPQAVRIVLGVLMVFFVPGFVMVRTALPERRSSVERLLASVGLSVTVATCTAVFLAAIPVGLSRGSLGVLLGGFTVVLSLCGMYRTRSTTERRGPAGPPAQRREGQLGDKVAVKR